MRTVTRELLLVWNRMPLPPTGVHEPQVCLVHERGPLEQVTAPLAGHVPRGDALHLAVDERQQLLRGGVVAVTPLHEQGRHPGWVPSDMNTSERRRMG